MNITILTSVYDPEPVVSARIAKDIAHGLTEQNHKVNVICPFPSRPKGEIFDGYRRTIWKKDSSVNSFNLIRLFSFISPKSTFLSRFLENISFGITSSLYLLFVQKKPDVLFLNTWPIFAVYLNISVARIRGIKIVRSIQDIYPETLLSQKRLAKNNALYKFLGLLERYNYKNSNLNITISEKMRSVIYSRYPDLPPPLVVANWHTISAQSEKIFNRSDINKNLSNSDTVYLYGGNISTASNVIGLVKCFNDFSFDKENAKLVIAGSGPLYNDCSKLVQSLGAQDHIFFHSPWEPNNTLPILEMADILLLPTDNEQAIYSVPSKIISYMTSSRPILGFGAIDSELESLISLSGCGWFYLSNNEREMRSGLQKAYESSDQERLLKGLNGYTFMSNNLCKEANLKKIIHNILMITND